jgi:hypothetical protein
MDIETLIQQEDLCFILILLGNRGDDVCEYGGCPDPARFTVLVPAEGAKPPMPNELQPLQLCAAHTTMLLLTPINVDHQTTIAELVETLSAHDENGRLH